MEKKQIHTNQAPAAIGPYSQAIDLGELVFTSGQIPVCPADGTVSEDIAQQAHQCLQNVKAVLEAAGSSMDKVIKTTVFIADMAQFGTINGVYEQYFSQPYPARSCVEVAKLPKGVGIEVEAIALK